MSDTQKIIDLGNQITAYGVQHQRKMDELSAARNAANEAAVQVSSVSTTRAIFIDALNGSDENTGTSPATPIKTWSKAITLLHAGRRCTLGVMSDLVIDTLEFIQNPPAAIEIYGAGADGYSAQLRTITINDATNGDTWVGGLYSFTNLTLSTNNIDVVMDYTHGFTPFTVALGLFVIRAQRGEVRKTGSSTYPLFDPTCNGHVLVFNFVIDPSASGFVLRDVPAGGDPNAKAGLSANFTTA